MTAPSRATVTLTAIAWVLLSLAVVVLTAIAGGRARVPYVAAVVAAVLVARLVVLRLGDVSLTTSWPSEARPVREADLANQRGAVDGRTLGIESNLRRLATDPSSYERRLQPTLRELATHGLRQRGIDPDADPDAARAALGDDVWAMLYTERPGGPTPTQVVAALDHIERLTTP